jgi:hypothetical protein
MSSLLWAHKQLEGRGKRLTFNNERSNKKHTRTTKMTDDQINVAIAEACGWVDRGSFNESRPEDHKFKRRIRNTENYEWRWQHKFNYCNDLNAMHEAEATLTEDQLWRMAREIERNDEQWYFRATARQRAEAFLRTVGKWEDDK